MACATYALGLVIFAANINMCFCRNILPLTRLAATDRPEASHFSIYKTPVGSDAISFSGSYGARLKQGINRTNHFPLHKANVLATAVNENRSKLLRMRRELKQDRIKHFGLTGAVYDEGLLLYNQYISLKDLDDTVHNGYDSLEQQLKPWPVKDKKVTVPYFFSESKKPFDKAIKWLRMGFEEVTAKTCVTMQQAEGIVGGDCDRPAPRVANALCIEAGDRCHSQLGAGSNPQRLVVNETCLSPSMALRLVTLAVGLGYQNMHTNFMQADAGHRAEHGYCHPRVPDVSDRFDVKSASAIGFTIDSGSTEYAAVHVTPRPEDQALLQNRRTTLFGLRNIDVAAINTFNQCEELVYGSDCGSMLRTCQKYTKKYPNVIGLTKDCACRCRDGWEGRTCGKAVKEKTPKGFYGCHKNVLLRRGDAGGVSPYFNLRDIHLDLVSEPPYLCTVNVLTKWRDLGFYCRGYAPIIRIDARALYKVLRGLEPFSMRAACHRFRLYFQSGADRYQRRLICTDTVLESGGELMLRARGPNATLFFVMNPENKTEAEALAQMQVAILNRLHVTCDSVIYYRNPLSFNVHRSEFQFHAKYLIELLIGIVVFMVISYVAYDYWMTRRRVEQMRHRRQAKAAEEAEEAEEAKEEESSSDSSDADKSRQSSASKMSTNSAKSSASSKASTKGAVGGEKAKAKKPAAKAKPAAKGKKAAAKKAEDEDDSSSDDDSFFMRGSKRSTPPSTTSAQESSDASATKKAGRRPTLNEIAAKQPKEKKKKEKSELPPIAAPKAKVRQVSDLGDLHTANTSPVVEEPTSFLSNDSVKTPTPPPTKSPRRFTKKGKKSAKKRADSGSSSSDETLKQAMTRYISQMVNSTSDSEDDESKPA